MSQSLVELGYEIEEQMDQSSDRGGGGGRKFPKDRFGRDSTTKNEHSTEEARLNNKELVVARREVRDRLEILIFSKEVNPAIHHDLRNYLDWVIQGIEAVRAKEMDLIMEQKDLKEKFTKDSGPGGQRRNKVSTAVWIEHGPTKIKLKYGQETEQFQNRKKARELMFARLAKNIWAWNKIVGEGDYREVISKKLDEIFTGKQFRVREEDTLRDIKKRLEEHRNIV